MKIAVIQLKRYLRAYDLLCGYTATPAIPSVPSS